jgi:hypothetical protein
MTIGGSANLSSICDGQIPDLKSILLILPDAAMFFRYLPIGANPMALVKVPTLKAAPKGKPRC